MERSGGWICLLVEGGVEWRDDLPGSCVVVTEWDVVWSVVVVNDSESGL